MRPCTDLGNAERYADQHHSVMRHVRRWGAWMYWNGKVWREDDTGEADRKARITVRSIGAEAAAIKDEDVQKAVVQWAKQSEALARLRALVELASADPRIAVASDVWDRDENLLNTQTGIVDLRTSTVAPHDPARYCAKITGAGYDPMAHAPEWDALLEWAFCGDAELKAWFQRAVGATLFGHQKEQVFFFCYGGGGNGKGTILNTLKRILGKYAQELPKDFCIVKKHQPHETELADLCGARMAVGSEVDPTATLDESKVKQLTGGDPVKARKMRENYFEFEPTWLLWLMGNHKPRVRGNDDGIWRRMRLIPFLAKIEEGKKDLGLPDRLIANESAGILQWAIEGARLWEEQGLGMCAAVKAASAEYREAEDVVGQFLADCCEINPAFGWTTAKGVLRNSFEAWCAEQGIPPAPNKLMVERLLQEGIVSAKSGSERKWRNVRLVGDAPTLPMRSQAYSPGSVH